MVLLDHSHLACIALIAATFLVIFFRKKANHVRTLYPPGPHPYPIIGNLYDFPLVQPWVTYTQWRKKYGKPQVLLLDVFAFYLINLLSGDIVYCNAMGQHVIILNSLKVTIDLFEKRSNMYSDRPVLPMRDMYICSLCSPVWKLLSN